MIQYETYTKRQRPEDTEKKDVQTIPEKERPDKLRKERKQTCKHFLPG